MPWNSLAALIISAAATAPTDVYNYTFEVKDLSSDHPVCREVPDSKRMVRQGATALLIRFEPPAEVKLGAVLAEIQGDKEKTESKRYAAAELPKNLGFAVRIPVEDVRGKTAKLALKVSSGPMLKSPVDLLCTPNFIELLAASTPDKNDVGGDLSALKFWAQNAYSLESRAKEQGKNLGLPRDTQFLVHLPSGATAFPFPAGVTEGVPLQVAVLMPADGGAVPGMQLQTCPSVQTFRTTIEPENEKSAKDNAHKQAAVEGMVRFDLVPIGPYFRCGAGELTYRIRPLPKYAAQATGATGLRTQTGSERAQNASGAPKEEQQDKQHEAGKDAQAPEGREPPSNAAPADEDPQLVKIRVRPKYHLAAIALVGWDRAARTKYEKQRSAADANVIAFVDDRVGVIAYVGGVWMIGGVDYEDMRWYNYFANVFVAVNASNPTKDVVAGLTLTPVGSVSLAVGASLHVGQRLSNGYRVGDTFTGDGAIPVSDTWSGVKPGFFVGLSIDSNIYTALTSKKGS